MRQFRIRPVTAPFVQDNKTAGIIVLAVPDVPCPRGASGGVFLDKDEVAIMKG